MAHTKVTKGSEKQSESIEVTELVEDSSPQLTAADAVIDISNLKTVNNEIFNKGFETMNEETFLELIPVNSYFH